MAENRTLLSQSEIDALVSFLQHDDTSKKTTIGEVLDQSSIDKLVDLIRLNNDRGVFLDSDSADIAFGAGSAEIINSEGSAVDKSDCELDFRVTPEGMAEICCVDMADASFYKISPESLIQGKLVSDGSEWGRAVSPRHFCMVAELFGLEYAPEVYNSVVARFAEIMYGSASAKPSDIYYPAKN